MDDLDDQSSWRGHSFTMLIFGGVVVLCSIFFILGMLVGRAQVEFVAATTPAELSAEEADPDEFDLTFYESVEQDETQPLESVRPAAPAPDLEAEVRSGPQDVEAYITLQIAALSNAEQAAKLLEEIRSKGFGKAFYPRSGSG